MPGRTEAEVIIIGGGIAGVSAAIYLGRAERDTLIIDAGKSMARWEPDVQNYLGFPEGIAGDELLRRGREQAARYHVTTVEDEVLDAEMAGHVFVLEGRSLKYHAKRVLIATGIYHLPPEIEGVSECLGHSMFFCKDCDGFRIRGKRIAIYGWSNETVEYALGMLFYTTSVAIVTNGKGTRWDQKHAQWIEEYKIPVYQEPIGSIGRQECQIRELRFQNGVTLEIDALFTTRGDVYFNTIARHLGAQVDEDGEIIVDLCLRTTVAGVYAAGCVTPANCQMIIAAGQGATAAQTINRDLFEESLATHALRRYRAVQLQDLRETGAPKDRKALHEATKGSESGVLGIGIEPELTEKDKDQQKGGGMQHIEKTIEVDAPVNKVYDQWTQFEDFPEFMEGVEEVRKMDERHLHWVAEIGGKKKEWDAEIYEQVPGQKVAWRSTSGARNAGLVEFQPRNNNRTRVTLKMDYEPEGTMEKVGDALGAVSRRVEGDLERFREFVESRET